MKNFSLAPWIGFLLLITGCILIFSVNNIFTFFLNQILPLHPGSLITEAWRKPPVPVIMKVYFFNVTNTHQLHEKDFKPHLEQLGPYTFSEYLEKVDIIWNENHTVTYQQIRTWYFDPENSNGTVEDEVTTLNVPLLGAVAITKGWSVFTAYSLSAASRMLHKSIWTKTKVKDALFEGIPDPLITIAHTLPGLSSYLGDILENTAIFPGRNGSSDGDGVYNIGTGVGNLSQYGEFHFWNYDNRSEYYDSKCGAIHGSASGIFNAGLEKGGSINLFHPELGRIVEFNYEKEVKESGVPAYFYRFSDEMLDNGTTYPESLCNCGGHCLRRGVMNASKRRRGLPAFISMPHFMGADPYYLNQVTGLDPNPDRHSTFLVVEPITGLPLAGSLRVQVNLLVEANQRISLYREVPTIMFPLLWLEELAVLPPRLSTLISLIIMMPNLVLSLSICLLILGLFLVSYNVLKFYLERIRKERHLIENAVPMNRTWTQKDLESQIKAGAYEMKCFLQDDPLDEEEETR